MPSIFIPDGFTMRSHIPAHKQGDYPAVDFTYRPATPGVRYEYSEAVGAEERTNVGARILCRQLVDLTAEDDGGKPQRVTLKEPQALKLHPDLFQTMLLTILGFKNREVEQAEANFPGDGPVAAPETPG